MTNVDPGQTYFPDQGSYPTDPEGRPRITVTPKGSPQGKEVDPWASYPDKPQTAPAATARAGGGDPWASYPDKPPEKARPEVGTGDAAVAGLTNVFGAGPAVAGLAGASGIEQPNMQEEVGLPEAVKRAGTTVARPFIGAYNMLHDYITGSGDGKAVEAYNAGRKANLDYNDAAYEAHPAAYIAGQLAQAIATPLSGAGAAARTATALGRSARAAGAGAAGGALFGTGEGISKGESPGDVALGAGSGALTGAALGGAAHGLLEGGGQVIGRARQLLAGSRNPRAEASRMLTEAFGEDAAGGRLQGFAPGTPQFFDARVADYAGPRVRRVADWAA